MVLAVMSDHDEADAEPDDAVVARSTCLALVALDVPVRDPACGG
ncbi:hypothetical protein [Jannaschia sp. R86511]